MDSQTYSDTRQIQCVELSILKQVKKICEENNITYYLSDGTVLGAVRHKGFIPWDDDIDIAIPRPDYNRFVGIAKEAFQTPYDVLIPGENNNYIFPFVKIVDKRFKVKTTSRMKEKTWYVWVDIFPLDVMPSNKLRCFIRKYYLLYRRMIYMFSCFSDMVSLKRPNRPLVERFLIRFAQITQPERFLNTYKQIVKLNRSLIKLPFDKGTNVISFHGAYKFRSMMDKSIYGNGTKLLFEDDYFSVPERYDIYLSSLYGNYMKLPPENQRNQHELKLVE